MLGLGPFLLQLTNTWDPKKSGKYLIELQLYREINCKFQILLLLTLNDHSNQSLITSLSRNQEQTTCSTRTKSHIQRRTNKIPEQSTKMHPTKKGENQQAHKRPRVPRHSLLWDRYSQDQAKGANPIRVGVGLCYAFGPNMTSRPFVPSF